MKPKSDGEIYEQISRDAMDKIDKDLHEQIIQMLIEMVSKDMNKKERPRKPWYRKERW